MTAFKDEAQGELPVIDLELGAKLLATNQATAREMIGQLVEMLPEDLKKIHSAYLEKDYEALKNLAHYVKGGASFCGTPRLKLAATRLDDIIHKQTSSADDIEKAYHQLCIEINKVISEYHCIDSAT